MTHAQEYAESLAECFGTDDPAKTVAGFVELEQKEPWRRRPAGFWPEVEAALTAIALEPAPAFFAFDSTGDAYDASNSNARIKSGSLLIIESEQVVGLAWAWPVAVTVANGNLHKAARASVITDADGMGATPDQLAAALAAATARGWAIDPIFLKGN